MNKTSVVLKAFMDADPNVDIREFKGVVVKWGDIQSNKAILTRGDSSYFRNHSLYLGIDEALEILKDVIHTCRTRGKAVGVNNIKDEPIYFYYDIGPFPSRIASADYFEQFIQADRKLVIGEDYILIYLNQTHHVNLLSTHDNYIWVRHLNGLNVFGTFPLSNVILRKLNGRERIKLILTQESQNLSEVCIDRILNELKDIHDEQDKGLAVV